MEAADILETTLMTPCNCTFVSHIVLGRRLSPSTDATSRNPLYQRVNYPIITLVALYQWVELAGSYCAGY
jgi:hypothetical protein